MTLVQEGQPYCPRIKQFREVFGTSTVSFIVTKNVTLSLLVEFAPWASHVCQELQDADTEDRAPEIPEAPNLIPAVVRGLWGSLRQAAVLLLRWIYDGYAHTKFSAEIAFMLLKDYRKEALEIFEAASSRHRIVLPLYRLSMEANYTYLLADFTVAVLFTTVRMRNVKDGRRMEYWLTNIGFQAAKNVLQLLLSPVGAVLGALLTSSVRGATVGHNLAEVTLTTGVECLALSYATR